MPAGKHRIEVTTTLASPQPLSPADVVLNHVGPSCKRGNNCKVLPFPRDIDTHRLAGCVRRDRSDELFTRPVGRKRHTIRGQDYVSGAYPGLRRRPAAGYAFHQTPLQGSPQRPNAQKCRVARRWSSRSCADSQCERSDNSALHEPQFTTTLVS